MNKKVQVLWTGGWDSTFRIVQLSRMDGVEVQGVYIAGDGRHSENYEIRAINNVIEALNKKQETKALIFPLKIVDKKDIPVNEKITEAYKRLRAEMKIGTQYDWLARYAFENPGVELGAILPDGEFSGVRETINRYAGLVQNGDTYKLDKEKATEDCLLVFGNFSYPMVYTKETEMVQMIKQWSYEDVMNLVWFCHRPYKGRPCGICRPCEQKMEGNMEFLLPDDAKRRYKIMKKMTGAFGNKGRTLLYKMYRI